MIQVVTSNENYEAKLCIIKDPKTIFKKVLKLFEGADKCPFKYPIQDSKELCSD